jgi:membrane protein DedA with SNARE-associated domain
MMEVIQKISVLVAEQAYLAGPLSLLIAFMGCLVGTSLMMPSGAIITALGVLMGAGVVSWTFILWAIGGAALGMSVSYGLGQWFGPRLLTMPIVQARPQLVERVRALFARYGVIAILIGYYTGPPRSLVASTAAIAGMPRVKFEIANILFATIWVAGAATIGAVPGTLIEPDSPWLLAGALIMPVVTIALTVLLLRAAL